MHHALTVLTEELRRLKATGVKTVLVSDESLARLKAAQRTRTGAQTAQVVAAPASSDQKMSKSQLPVTLAPSEAVTKREPEAAAAANLPAPIAFELPSGEKQFRMAALRERVVNDAVCQANVRSGKQVVLGVGSLDAKIMFVGEAPGAEEEERGEPFVGPAGQLLTKMIGAMGLNRDDVYLGNIMNWRPQLEVNESGVQYGNRPPNTNEMTYCLPYLRAQVAIVNPALLVALGTTAAQGLLGVGAFKALGEVRGQWKEFAGLPLMVTYHPSYILRNQSNRSKRMIWDDLLKVMDRAGLPITDRQRAFFLDK